MSVLESKRKRLRLSRSGTEQFDVGVPLYEVRKSPSAQALAESGTAEGSAPLCATS